LVQDRGGAEFKTGGIRLYVEDFTRGTNPAKGGRPKDIFEMGFNQGATLISFKTCASFA
jgi:hypothetical protein